MNRWIGRFYVNEKGRIVGRVRPVTEDGGPTFGACLYNRPQLIAHLGDYIDEESAKGAVEETFEPGAQDNAKLAAEKDPNASTP